MVRVFQALDNNNDCMMKLQAEREGYRLMVFNMETLLSNETFVTNAEASDEKLADLFRKAADMTRDGS